MPTIAEQLASLTQIDPLDNREENPVKAPYTKGSWAASIGRLIGGFGYVPLTVGTENVAIHSTHEIKLAKDWAVAIRRGPQFADVVGASLQIWLRNRNAEKHGLRLIATRTAANIYTFKVEYWYNGELLEVFGEESFRMAVGGSFALVLTNAKGEESFENAFLSIWVQQEEEGEWQQITEAEIEPIYLIELGEEGRYTGVGVVGNSGSFSPSLADLRSAQLEEEEPEPPSVTTFAASGIGLTSASGNGLVDPNGLATEYWVEYGTTEALGSKTSVAELSAEAGEQFVNRLMSGLAEGTKYFFRMVAKNEAGGTKGSILSFTTLKKEAPGATTNAASGIGGTKATLNGTVDPNLDATTYWFEYGTDAALAGATKTAEKSAGEGGTGVAKSEAVEGLEYGTKYYFRVVAKNSKGETKGTILSFTTSERPRIAIERELPPHEVSVNVAVPGSNRPVRFGPDEPLPEFIISDVTLTDEIPGGYKDFSAKLARDPQRAWHDLFPYGKVTAMGPGREKLWEGSIDKGPRMSGEESGVSPTALGNQYILDDHQAVSAGYIHADVSEWHGDPSLERKKILVTNNIKAIANMETGLSSLDPTGLAPGVFFDFTDLEQPAATETYAAEAYFESNVDIERFLYDYDQITSFPKAAEWTSQVAGATTDTIATFVLGTNHQRADASQQELKITNPGYKVLRIRDARAPTGVVARLTDVMAWKNLKVLGRHGLTLRGTWPEVGLRTSDMLQHFINNYCGPLEATEASIEDDGWVHPHAWWSDGSPAADIIKEMVKYALYDWFVYRGNLVEYRRPGTYGRRWRALTVPSGLNEVGIDSQRLWRSVVVRYQDTDGRTRTVGPPGSGATYTSEGLEVTDPNHPAVRAKRARRDMLELQGVATPETARAVGERFLAEANLLNRSGSATLVGYVRDDRGVLHPVSHVKSGDWIAFTDASDTSYRKIVSKAYNQGDLSCEIDLDAPPTGLEALLERLQVATLVTGAMA